MNTKDTFYMQRALALARRAEGRTSPNPVVGCVIVKNGRVIAEGWHQKCGSDHAEAVALKKAGVRAKGATLYVTLEPCAHWGRTPPCVDAVIAAGVTKVVMAMTDPNPLTNGRSIRALKAAGIKVVTDVCADEARELNRIFIKHITTGMPFVIAKTAQTLDGRIATRTGDSRWITSEATRAVARDKRNAVDAILVGINTVLADDPRLEAPAKALVKVIVDSRARLSPKARLFRGTTLGQVIVAVLSGAPAKRILALKRRGADVVICRPGAGGVDLKALFKELARRRITSILIEGGAAVIGSALKAGLVDAMHLYIAPRIMGDSAARPSIDGLRVSRLTEALTVNIDRVERLGPDLFMEISMHRQAAKRRKKE